MGGGYKVHAELIAWGGGYKVHVLEGEDTKLWAHLVRKGSCDWPGPLSLPPRENAPVVHTGVCVCVCVCV